MHPPKKRPKQALFFLCYNVFVMRRVFFIVLIFSFLIINSGWPGLIADASVNCLTLTPNSSQSDKDYCKKELAKIEAELAELVAKQKEQQKQSGTLQGDVNYLASQINALKSKIKARELAIAQIKVSINEKASRIETLSEKIEKQHESIAQLIRNTNDFDNQNLVHLVLSGESLSQFYSDLESYSAIKEAVKDSVDEIKGIRVLTEQEKKALEEKRNAEADARYELENARTKVAQSEAEKKKLLSISKQQEATYRQLAAQKKEVADKIRAALFPLRDSKAIPFGQALEFAEAASKKTGVRPAFVLAILTQESALGANVGTCNRPTDPPEKHWTKIMKPERDIAPFQRITTALGISPEGVPLSCPWGSGWGGAMGPAQFIPSTWEMYATKIKNALGISGPANPWEPRHAFMASSIYLGELGASAGTFTAERTAALKYYAGGNWAKPANAFYGDGVMQKATKIQADIDLLYD